MNPPNRDEIAKRYNLREEIWSKKDKWHWITFKIISHFISKIYPSLTPSPKAVLNAGSAGNNYCISPELVTHIDLAQTKLENCENAIIGSIENIPKSEETFDLIVCVGSVINYCDPVKAIGEFNRVSRSKAKLILEFENSKTLELIGKRTYGKKTVLTDTFYGNQTERLWYHSESFIREILEENGYEILACKRFHIFSPLLYRLTKKINVSVLFSKVDAIFRLIPFLRKNSSNVILVAQKR
jgi:SAM-dependent methyltransferase